MDEHLQDARRIRARRATRVAAVLAAVVVAAAVTTPLGETAALALGVVIIFAVEILVVGRLGLAETERRKPHR